MSNVLGERDMRMMLELEREALGREMRQARTVTLADGLVGAVVAIQYHAGRVELLETVLGLRPRPRDLDRHIGPTWPSREEGRDGRDMWRDEHPRNVWPWMQRQSSDGVPIDGVPIDGVPILPKWDDGLAQAVTLTWLPVDAEHAVCRIEVTEAAHELDAEARLRAIIAAARERVYGAGGVGATLGEEDGDEESAD